MTLSEDEDDKSDIPESGFTRLLSLVSLKECVVILLFLLLWAYSILLYYRSVWFWLQDNSFAVSGPGTGISTFLVTRC